jgi:hypothetical protein
MLRMQICAFDGEPMEIPGASNTDISTRYKPLAFVISSKMIPTISNFQAWSHGPGLQESAHSKLMCRKSMRGYSF